MSYAGAAAERLFSIYKRAISPALHSFSLGGCRFQPTRSSGVAAVADSADSGARAFWA